MAWDGMKSTLSLILGVILTILGGLPLLNKLGVTVLALPAGLSGALPQLVAYILAVGGFYLLIDAWDEWGEWYFWVTVVVGLAALTAGVIMALHSLGVLGFTVPFMTPTAYNSLFVVEGLLLIWGSFNQL